MDWYHYIAWAAVLAQSVFVYAAIRNYRYVRAKSVREGQTAYRPRAALIVPCKGLDAHFHSNIASLLDQEYDNHRVFFVVESESDPAYRQLQGLLTTHSSRVAGDSTHDASILVAGPSRSAGQKIHNLLYAYRHVPEDTEVLVFADSDIRVQRDWLSRLVRPLYRPRCGVSTGYRWFIPTRTNLASLVLSAINGAVAQFLGNSPFNQAWGGSMAVRIEDFRRLGIPEIWSNTLSDDLSLSRAVKQDGRRVIFVPECLVASYEATTWPGLWEFGRRQLLITRIYAPGTWWLGFLSSLGSVLGLWGVAVVAVYASLVAGRSPLEVVSNDTAPRTIPSLLIAVPFIFLASQIIRAVLRQLAAMHVLSRSKDQPSGASSDERPATSDELLPAAVADILGCWLWSVVLLVLLLASAFGRTIRWRGIRYRLISPTRTEVLS